MFIRVQDKIINTNDISHIEVNINDARTIFIRMMQGGNVPIALHYKSAAEAKNTIEWLTEVLVDAE
jgi:hypothetical protein